MFCFKVLCQHSMPNPVRVCWQAKRCGVSWRPVYYDQQMHLHIIASHASLTISWVLIQSREGMMTRGSNTNAATTLTAYYLLSAVHWYSLRDLTWHWHYGTAPLHYTIWYRMVLHDAHSTSLCYTAVGSKCRPSRDPGSTCDNSSSGSIIQVNHHAVPWVQYSLLGGDLMMRVEALQWLSCIFTRRLRANCHQLYELGNTNNPISPLLQYNYVIIYCCKTHHIIVVPESMIGEVIAKSPYESSRWTSRTNNNTNTNNTQT